MSAANFSKKIGTNGIRTHNVSHLKLPSYRGTTSQFCSLGDTFYIYINIIYIYLCIYRVFIEVQGWRGTPLAFIGPPLQAIHDCPVIKCNKCKKGQISINCFPISKYCKKKDHLIENCPTRPQNKNQSHLNQPSNLVLVVTNNSGLHQLTFNLSLVNFSLQLVTAM
ncbi:hypothetical protein RDI58_015081 [Solanum bulbocastanum]|uniref:Uncharacterized protein n=1 Tax=Solanum bulbocastanum TaxID=147425 RepID=A0AAN8TJI0_SOLBU